ncbi:hypothetical protein XELAEV_18022028mg [Xenopus laevis]|uniref:Secreted protein n=1 Tax=Xenopus laevis TaxID=8355 RepID=A0A974D1L2_XENLA|nr:hypothetical protein XELAEV_18022028mg [Xenopus laevis]
MGPCLTLSLLLLFIKQWFNDTLDVPSNYSQLTGCKLEPRAATGNCSRGTAVDSESIHINVHTVVWFLQVFSFVAADPAQGNIPQATRSVLHTPLLYI